MGTLCQPQQQPGNGTSSLQMFACAAPHLPPTGPILLGDWLRFAPSVDVGGGSTIFGAGARTAGREESLST